MSPIRAISGSFLSIVILQYLLNSHARIAGMPPLRIPTSSPIAPEKKLSATISGISVPMRAWSLGSIEISYLDIYASKSSGLMTH